MKHCVLAPLPGRGSLAGEILSHDFVEAALMRRAGYGVWIAYDLDGSYEETPPNLLDEVKRDRRWCHGNLMNARLMFARGMHPVHRWVFLTGALAYLSAPLWLGFLVLSTWLLLAHVNVEPQYFVMPHQLFPLWPSWRPEHAVTLFSAVAAVLFLPKIMAALLAAVRSASSYGGVVRLMLSVLAEMLMSALLAPVRMLFHTQFVFAALLGWSIHWKSPARADKSTPLMQALRRHGLQTAIGLAWIGVVAWKAPDVLPWLAPVAAGLLLVIPISVLTSYPALGLLARKAKLFMTPDETRPPREVVETAQYARNARALPRFVDAVIDPEIHAVVRSAARRSRSALAAAQCMQQVERALQAGPDALSHARARRIAARQRRARSRCTASRGPPLFIHLGMRVRRRRDAQRLKSLAGRVTSGMRPSPRWCERGSARPASQNDLQNPDQRQQPDGRREAGGCNTDSLNAAQRILRQRVYLMIHTCPAGGPWTGPARHTFRGPILGPFHDFSV